MSNELRSRAVFAASLAAIAAALSLSTVAIASGPAGSFADRPETAARPQTDAVTFLKRVMRQIVGNDYASAWLTLNPAQRQAIPQAEYVQCELLSPIPGQLDWIKATRVVSERIVVAGGSSSPVPSRAVTFRLKLSEPALQASMVITHTAHAVAAG